MFILVKFEIEDGLEIIYVDLNFVPGGIGIGVGVGTVNSHLLGHGVMHFRLVRILVHEGDDACGELSGGHDKQQSSILSKYILFLVQFVN